MADPGHKRAQHLIEAEAFRRIMAGELPATLDAFATQLSAWLLETHPQAARVSVADIERQIQDTWHRRHDMIRGGA